MILPFPGYAPPRHPAMAPVVLPPIFQDNLRPVQPPAIDGTLQGRPNFLFRGNGRSGDKGSVNWEIVGGRLPIPMPRTTWNRNPKTPIHFEDGSSGTMQAPIDRNKVRGYWGGSNNIPRVD